MWIFTSVDTPAICHLLVCGREYLFGRKDADILLENDMSISRKHAILQVIHAIADVMNPQKIPLLRIQDLSKIGTMIGDQRFIKNSGVVQNGDIVWFGNLQKDTSKYRAVYEQYIATTSCLDMVAKRSTRQLLSELGGHLIGDWRKDCNVLIMSNLSITIKAICALIAQKPIITPKYLEDWIKALKSGAMQPKSDDYLPPLAESQLDPREVSFKPNPKRQTLFQGLTFIFLTSKQFKKLSVAVGLGGGTPLLLDCPSADGDDILVSSGSCVMSCDLNEQSQQLTKKAYAWIEHVFRTLQKYKKRPLQECEVGYAVLYCSVKKHCNPDVEQSIPGTMIVPVDPQTVSQNVGVSQLQHTTTQQRGNDPDTLLDQIEPEAKKNKRSLDRSQLHQTSLVKVKCEEVSLVTEPDTTSYSVSRHGRKRERVDDSDQSDGTPMKKTNILRGFKQEDITPQKTTDNVADSSVSVMTREHKSVQQHGRKRNSSSPIQPGPGQHGNAIQSLSPEPLSPKQCRKTRTSPSPAPSSPNLQCTSPRKHSSSPELFDTDALLRSAPQHKTKVNVPKTDNYVSRNVLSTTSHMAFSSDDDNIGSGVEEGDIFASIPKRKGRGKPDPKSAHKLTESEGSSTEKATSRINIVKRTIKSEPVAVVVGCKSDDIHVGLQNKDGQKATCRPKQEHKAMNVDAGTSVARKVNQKFPVEGFISRKDPGLVPVDDEFIDKDIVPTETVIEERSLVVRKSGQGPRSRTKTTEVDNTRWHGKIVKNFKTFRKTSHSGQNGLPQIIGGMDLVTHENIHSQKMDTWLKDYIESDSQPHRSQIEDDDCFDIEPRRVSLSTTKKRHR